MATVTVPVPPVVNPPNNSQSNLEKIESFINDTTYKEILESSVNFNTRLCIERRLRLPFIDTQTGVAQNHCSLFMHKRQRLPGLSPGQIYSYPRQRWRKKRRQYLSMNVRAYARHAELLDGEGDIHNINQIENPALQDTDSKDSQLLSGEVSKEWFYDEQEMLEMETYDEPDPDSDLDYEESYTKRRRGRKSSGRGRSGNDSPSTPGRKRGAGRGRGKKTGPGGHNYDPTPGDPDKPFACERTPGRRGPRPPGAPPQQGGCSPGPQPPGPPQMMPSPNQAPPTLPPNLPPQPPPNTMGEDPPMPILKPEKVIEIPLVNAMPPMPPQEHLMMGGPSSFVPPVVADRKVPPSPYCDFCLGDSTQNKKTGGMEELVSCHDCGRSGHPTCLQFTDNMKVSVKKYRWQCIECKCCSVCGTSDNDDQLLFCDDCDRGYHMYCLSPPLENPPEGSWSCKLCIEQFHQK